MNAVFSRITTKNFPPLLRPAPAPKRHFFAAFGILFSLASVQALSQEITTFPIYSKDFKAPHQATIDPVSKRLSGADEPLGIAVAADGNVWFTEGDSERIGKMTPDGVVKEYETGLPHRSIALDQIHTSIVAAADGNMWFHNGSQIGSITPEGVVTLRHNSYSPDTYIRAIAAGPDGNVWYTTWQRESDVWKIAKITPSGAVREYPLPSHIEPMNLTAGSDGNIWFTAYSNEHPEEHHLVRIGKITRRGEITDYTNGITGVVTYGDPITIGADGNLWFFSGEKIASITTKGHVTEYPIDREFDREFSSLPRNLVKGPDGNLWGANVEDEAVDKFTLPNKVNLFHLPHFEFYANGMEMKVAVGHNNDLWFTGLSGAIGHITMENAFLSGFDIAMPTETIISKMRQPSNSIELLKNIKIVIKTDLLSRDDFYTSGNFEKVFGVDQVKIKERPLKSTEGEDQIMVEAVFENREGINLTLWKRKISSNNTRFTAGIQMVVPQGKELINFDDVQQILGANWQQGEKEFDSSYPEHTFIKDVSNGIYHLTTFLRSNTDPFSLTEIHFTETTDKDEHAR